jgi:chemotaxis protein methyltransferase CheR
MTGMNRGKVLEGSGRDAPAGAQDTASEAAAYQQFCAFLERASGITLGTGKEYLVRSRLSRVFEEMGTERLVDVVNALEADRPLGLRLRVIDAMTTNETLWFRDAHPFELLATRLLPELEAAGKPLVRCWSAACSTGQEAYSISMVVSEYLAMRPRASVPRVEIVGTDISPSVLAQAQRAEYEEFELTRGLSEERLRRHFDDVGRRRRVREEVRARCSFRELNLLGSFTLLGRFDLVFCRNVLIYFSPATRQDILARIAGQMHPGACLLLGGSEPVSHYSEWFELQRYPRGVFYRRR